MKKYINNKLYDTTTAKLISESEQKKIYKKKTGEFFMVEGESLTPISYQEAKDILKSTDEEAYQKEFISLSAEKTLTFELSAENRQKLEELRAQTGKPLGVLINQLIEEYGGEENRSMYRAVKPKDGEDYYWLMKGDVIVACGEDESEDQKILVDLLMKESSGKIPRIKELCVIHDGKAYLAFRHNSSSILNITSRTMPVSMIKMVSKDYIEI